MMRSWRSPSHGTERESDRGGFFTPNRSSSELYASSSIRGDEISVNRANAHPKLARFFVIATSVIFGRETVGLILSARTWNIADNDSGRIAVYDNECNYVVEPSRILDVWFCRSLLSLGFSEVLRLLSPPSHHPCVAVAVRLKHPEFCAEIDRLSLMVHIASRAERLRIAMRVAKARVKDDDSVPVTDKDLLDWLKFAQSETDGAKIDLSKLAELLSGEQAQQDVVDGIGGNKRKLDQSVIETTATTSDSPDGPSASSSSQSAELDFNPS